MTFNERNSLIEKIITEYKTLHDKYTSSKKVLSDPEWETYIHSMDAIMNEYRGTNLDLLAGKLNQAFLDDTELVQKKLKENEKVDDTDGCTGVCSNSSTDSNR